VLGEALTAEDGLSSERVTVKLHVLKDGGEELLQTRRLSLTRGSRVHDAISAVLKRRPKAVLEESGRELMEGEFLGEGSGAVLRLHVHV
jgi:hypothetical protein